MSVWADQPSIFFYYRQQSNLWYIWFYINITQFSIIRTIITIYRYIKKYESCIIVIFFFSSLVSHYYYITSLCLFLLHLQQNGWQLSIGYATNIWCKTWCFRRVKISLWIRMNILFLYKYRSALLIKNISLICILGVFLEKLMFTLEIKNVVHMIIIRVVKRRIEIILSLFG